MPDDEVTQINLKSHDDENGDRTLEYTAVSPDGNLMAVWSDKKMVIYNLAQGDNKKVGEFVREVPIDLEGVLGRLQICFCPNSKIIAVFEAKRIWLCDIESGDCSSEYKIP